MKTAHILFIDLWLPKGFISGLLAQTYQLEAIALGDIFREALKTTDALADEVRGYMDKGEIIPTEMVERMILWGVQHRPRFLLMSYPRSVEQFESFMKFCTTHAISVEKLWYFKTEDFGDILNNTAHFSKLHWTAEEIEEHNRKRLSEHERFRGMMDSILQSYKHLWHVVQLQKEEFVDAMFITSKISR